MTFSRRLFFFFSAFVLVSSTLLSSLSHAEIVRFLELEPGKVFRGGQPETIEDYALLQKHGIRTLINMKTSGREIESERRLAKAFGMTMISIPISPVFGPSDQTVDAVQGMMQDPRLQPVFIHCRHGKDRTGLMAGVYRVEQQGWTPDAAYAEMRSLGFNPWLVGLRHRFWDRVEDRGFSPNLLEAELAL